MSARRFDLVGISAIAPPDALEEWTYEGILGARVATFLEYWQAARAADPTLPDFNVEFLESDPAIIHQQADAFREGLVRQRVNDAVLATSLIFAVGADLDVIAAGYSTLRAEGETDASLRLRALLAWENLSIGGSYGGYEYQARSAAPADIADCVVYGHEVAGVALGEVRIVLLGSGHRGAVAPALVDRVQAQLTRRDIRKVNDLVTVEPATIITYAIDATLVTPPGADGETVRAAKLVDAQAYCAARKRIAAPVTYHGLMNALGDDDPSIVLDIEMRAPFRAKVDPKKPPRIGGGPFEAPVCTSITLDWRAA